MSFSPFSLVLHGPPRTKKTSNRIVQIKGKDGGRGFTKILPSEAYEQWLDFVLLQGAQIRSCLLRAGISLPIHSSIGVRALIFRDRSSGDLLGYEQAIADSLHSPQYRFVCAGCATPQLSIDPGGIKCRECGRLLLRGKQVRKGLGIIRDDSQIAHWDGSRLLKDVSRPRVEITISECLEVPQEQTLFAMEEAF